MSAKEPGRSKFLRNRQVAIPLLSVLCLALTGCQIQEDRPAATATPVEYQRDFPVLEIEDENFSTEVAKSLEFVEVDSLPPSEQQEAVVNPVQDTQAFIVVDERYRIFVEEFETNQVYELQGPFQPGRPFSRLTWLDNNVLAFDQWSTPHHGVHYEIDIRERKLIYVSIITDMVDP